MRAKMSDRTMRLPISQTADPAGVCGMAHARAAEREARAIMAETEPTAYADWHTVHLGIHCLPGAGRADRLGATIDAWGGVVALAEALAAFVAEGEPELTLATREEA